MRWADQVPEPTLPVTRLTGSLAKSPSWALRVI
jgi:hypothetical protein